MASNKFQNLSDDNKLKLKKAYKAFATVEAEIVDSKEQQRDIILNAAKDIDNVVSKKDIKRIFGFLKKQTTPQDIRDIANLMEEIEGSEE
jgi:hypothetical protein